jgi:hypothetical protein
MAVYHLTAQPLVCTVEIGRPTLRVNKRKVIRAELRKALAGFVERPRLLLLAYIATLVWGLLILAISNNYSVDLEWHTKGFSGKARLTHPDK